MRSEKQEVGYVKVSDLKNGMKILNVGIVKKVHTYSNVVVVDLWSNIITNADQAYFSPFAYVFVDSVDGKPVIIDRYDKPATRNQQPVL